MPRACCGTKGLCDRQFVLHGTIPAAGCFCADEVCCLCIDARDLIDGIFGDCRHLACGISAWRAVPGTSGWAITGNRTECLMEVERFLMFFLFSAPALEINGLILLGNTKVMRMRFRQDTQHEDINPCQLDLNMYSVLCREHGHWNSSAPTAV